jgi:hypothetical protein
MDIENDFRVGWLVAESTGPTTTTVTRKEAWGPLANGWRVVFSGDAIHAPTVARQEGCEGVAAYLPKTTYCSQLILYRHESGESAAYYAEGM